MNRRKFLQTTAALGGVVAASPLSNSSVLAKFVLSPNYSLADKASIVFVKTTDRTEGIKKALEILDFNSVKDK